MLLFFAVLYNMINTKQHGNNDEWKRKYAKSIEIGDYFWGGTNAFILGGSAIGDECVLGAGAVIQNKEVPERSLLVGNPARKIGVTRSS